VPVNFEMRVDLDTDLIEEFIECIELVHFVDLLEQRKHLIEIFLNAGVDHKLLKSLLIRHRFNREKL